eukprot:TRINITY_DN3242_c0_g1_i2.p1 TRINITY_DN3242_c0_g1~~TRINITY_DN3242_c0_g1_i2.p1  ORF type:complete len:594 (+),score=219.81 TRINITY_DN3242_c0_g1_i2:147-1928(+)
MFKPPQVGNVHVRVDEIREVKKEVKSVEILYDDAVETQKPPTSDAKSEALTFPVHSLQSDVEVVIITKKLIGHKRQGHYKISIPSLQDVPEKHEWFPLTKIIKQKDVRKLNKEGGPTKVGEIRLWLKYESLKPKVERKVKGVIIDSQWTKETSGGTLMNSPNWMKNPQFKLALDEKSEVCIKLTQPQGVDEKVSFYVVKYEDWWESRPKVIFNPEEIVKIDNFWGALFGEEAEARLKLDKGSYVIIPCSENAEHTGNFSINVWHYEDKTEGEDGKDEKEDTGKKLDFVKVDPAEWKSKSLKNQWTKTTAGGGNINGIKWRRNPQFMLTPSEDSKVSIVLSQEEKDHSIGLYVIKYEGYGKKMLEYTNEVAKTSAFKFTPTVGIPNVTLSKGQSYCIIPATSEPKEGNFTLTIFSDKDFKFSEIASTWASVASRKSHWKGETAGGSPNFDTFVNNPQFLVNLPGGKNVELLVDLVASDEFDAIGFLLIKREKSKKIKRIKNKEKVKPEDIICKPDGWINRMSVGSLATIPESVTADYHFVVIPSTFNPDIRKTFEISVYSDEKVSLQRLDDEGVMADSDSESESESDESSEDDK